MQDQLEIIGPTGNVRFCPLNMDKGITNIGWHDNHDVVLPDVVHFHAVLDHRQTPYQIMILSQEREATLQDKPLKPNEPTPLHFWDTIKIDGYMIMLLQGASAPVAAEGVAPPPQPDLLSPVIVNIDDPYIPIELSENEWTIEVGQTATCQVTITNGADVTAAFRIRVEGIDEHWVSISYPQGNQINLNEGESATIAVSITPPRHPGSRAGMHPLAITVTSPTGTHPSTGKYSRRSAMLTIAPYYQFSVGELAPKQQTIPWPEHSGYTNLAVINEGNEETALRIEATDNEQACDFEFNVPDEGSFVGQAEFLLSPERTYSVPIQITPHSPPVVFGRKRDYSFTVTTSLPGKEATPLARRGQVTSKPRFGLWVRNLITISVILIVVAVLGLVLRPATYCFNGESMYQQAESCIAGKSFWGKLLDKLGTANIPETFVTVTAGEAITLTWETSPANLEIIPVYTDLDRAFDKISIGESKGELIFVPPIDVTAYKLRAENLLSMLLPALASERTVSVNVEPVIPVIVDFQAPPEIKINEPVTLTWAVTGTDQLIVFFSPAIEGIGDHIPLPAQPTGMYTLQLDRTTTFRLEASHTKSDTTSQEVAEVRVLPRILSFGVNTDTVRLGESVMLHWSVIGADQVIIDRVGSVESNGYNPHNPDEQNPAYRYTLEAFNGNERVITWTTVRVDPPPAPPEILVLRFEPNPVIRGEEQFVKLYWEVNGEFDRIEISGPNFDPYITNVGNGEIPVVVEQTTFLILKAFGLGNQDMPVSETIELTIEEPTPTPTPTPTPMPTPIPPAIVFFKAESGADPPNSDQVKRGTEEGIYIVKPQASVMLSWEVRNADKVTLVVGDCQSSESSESSEPPVGSWTFDAQGVDCLVRYTLHAENSGGTYSQYVILDMLDIPAPNPPSNVNGIVGSNAVTITWNYSPEDANGNTIVGFTIYYASQPGEFAPLVQIDDSTRQWTDPNHDCGYYKLATRYVDPSAGTDTTTAASSPPVYSNDWLYGICPEVAAPEPPSN